MEKIYYAYDKDIVKDVYNTVMNSFYEDIKKYNSEDDDLCLFDSIMTVMKKACFENKDLWLSSEYVDELRIKLEDCVDSTIDAYDVLCILGSPSKNRYITRNEIENVIIENDVVVYSSISPEDHVCLWVIDYGIVNSQRYEYAYITDSYEIFDKLTDSVTWSNSNVKDTNSIPISDVSINQVDFKFIKDKKLTSCFFKDGQQILEMIKSKNLVDGFNLKVQPIDFDDILITQELVIYIVRMVNDEPRLYRCYVVSI